MQRYKYDSWFKRYNLLPFLPYYAYASMADTSWGIWDTLNSRKTLLPEIGLNCFVKLFYKPHHAIANLTAVTLMAPVSLLIAAGWIVTSAVHDIFSGARSLLSKCFASEEKTPLAANRRNTSYRSVATSIDSSRILENEHSSEKQRTCSFSFKSLFCCNKRQKVTHSELPEVKTVYQARS